MPIGNTIRNMRWWRWWGKTTAKTLPTNFIREMQS